MSALEDRYRRLLRWYPAEHRQVHEKEMLDVLLASAEPDRTRPAVRDVLDLVWGGLRVRMRRAPGAFVRGAWRDAAALLGVIAPLALLAETARYAVQAILTFPQTSYAATHGTGWWAMFSSAPSHLAWGVVAITALCGARRTTAALVVAAVLVDVTRFVSLDDYAGASAAAPLMLGLITAGALLLGPGPARGRRSLGRAGLIGIVALLAVTAPLDSMIARSRLDITWGSGRLALAIAALLAAAWLVRGAAGRRALIVLAVPLLPIVAAHYYPGYIEQPLARFLIILVAIPTAVGLGGLTGIVVLERLLVRPTGEGGRAERR
jgi:hypothetical protein